MTAAAAVSAATVVLVAALGITGTGRADVVGTALVGVWASLAAVVVLAVPDRVVRAPRRWRVAGAAMTLPYGVGQLVLAVQKASQPDPLPYPVAGDLLSFLAAPGWVALLLLVPRPLGPAGRLPRVLADAAAVASALALLFWLLAFAGRSAAPAAVAAAVATQLVELLLWAFVVQLAVVTAQRGTVLLALASSLIVAGDLLFSAALLVGAEPPQWQQAALLAASFPLMAVALLTVRTPRPRSEVAVEARASVVTVGLLAACGAVAVADVVVFQRPFDAVSGILLVLLLLACTVRELVLQRQRVRQVAALSEAAHHDPLTGLANRRALAAALAGLSTTTGPVGVVVLDLDGFKRVNDTLGHATGDRLVVAVARALRRGHPDAVVARLGGDEFAVVLALPEREVLEAADHLAGLVRESAGSVPGVSHARVSASIGVVVADAADLRDAADALAVVSRASAAMQEAKRRGRDRVVRHDEVAGAVARQRAVLRELAPALESGRGLAARTQPVVSLVSGAERGQHVQLGLVSPEVGEVAPLEVLRVARRHSLDAALSRHALRVALEGGGDAWVRVEAHQLHDDGWLAGTAALLRERSAVSGRLVLEVAGGVVPDDARAVAAMRALDALGVHLAVRGPGTAGGVLLPHLARLPVRAVVLEAPAGSPAATREDLVVTRGLVGLAHGLGLRVLAEGVTTAEQRDALAGAGVDLGRGPLWAADRLPVGVAAG